MEKNSPAKKRKCPAAVIGNGPSLRGVDFPTLFKGYATFGMNLAYRYWKSIRWYPTHYSCLDTVVGIDHKDDIHALIINAEQHGIQRFLLRNNLIMELGVERHKRVQNIDALLAENRTFFRSYWSNTGSLTTAWAAMLGYKRLVLFGMDASYIKYVQGAVHVNEIVLQLEEQPEHNPNYFFDGYQKKGDVYHIPLTEHPDFYHEDQYMGWHMIRPQLHRAQVAVVNASPLSKVDAFPKCRIDEIPAALRKEERRMRRMEETPPLFPECPRSAGCSLDILGLAVGLHGNKNGVFLDIGAHQGENSRRFIDAGWTVLAAEPDPDHHAVITRQDFPKARFQIVGEAVSCVPNREYPWCRHPHDGRLNAMKGFSNEYEQCGRARTTTVRKLVAEHALEAIDILYADIVGFEFMALRGVPYESLLPQCIVCAWDNSKSLHLGSDMHDLGSLLLAHGYYVFMSEWHPSFGRGYTQQWKRIVPYPAEPDRPQAWGHFLALRKKPARNRLQKLLNEHVHQGEALPPEPLPKLSEIQHPPYRLRF